MLAPPKICARPPLCQRARSAIREIQEGQSGYRANVSLHSPIYPLANFERPRWVSQNGVYTPPKQVDSSTAGNLSIGVITELETVEWFASGASKEHSHRLSGRSQLEEAQTVEAFDAVGILKPNCVWQLLGKTRNKETDWHRAVISSAIPDITITRGIFAVEAAP